MEHGTPRLVSFGRGGHTVHFASVRTSGFSSSKAQLQGYDSPESLEFAISQGKYADDGDLEGARVVDVRDAVGTAEGFRQVVSGPMVDVDLPDDGHNGFSDDDRKAAAGMVGPGGLSGAFATMAVLAQDRTYGGLDYVGVGTYLDLWRKAGARTGRIEGGRIIWDAG